MEKSVGSTGKYGAEKYVGLTAETLPGFLKKHHPTHVLTRLPGDKEPNCEGCNTPLRLLWDGGDLVAVKGTVSAQFIPMPFSAKPPDDEYALFVVLRFFCSACLSLMAKAGQEMMRRFMDEFPDTKKPIVLRTEFCLSCNEPISAVGGRLAPRRYAGTTYLYLYCDKCVTLLGAANGHEGTAPKEGEKP